MCSWAVVLLVLEQPRACSCVVLLVLPPEHDREHVFGTAALGEALAVDAALGEALGEPPPPRSFSFAEAAEADVAMSREDRVFACNALACRPGGLEDAV